LLHWWIAWGCIALSAVLTKATVWSAAIVSEFNSARGLALALALSGSAITGIVAPPIAQYLITEYSWRWAYAGMAFLWFCVPMTLILLFFRSAGDVRRTQATAQRERSEMPGQDLVEAIRSAAFIKLAIACFLVILVVGSGVVNFVPMLAERGLDRSAAVPLASLVGLTTFVGRLVTGSLLDRFDPRIVGSLAFLMPGVACGLLIIHPHEMPFVIAALTAVLIGASSGAELEVASYMSSRVFGLRNFGTLFGIIVGIIGLATGVGPLLASIGFDNFGSYGPGLWVSAAIAVAAALLLLTLPRVKTQL